MNHWSEFNVCINVARVRMHLSVLIYTFPYSLVMFCNTLGRPNLFKLTRQVWASENRFHNSIFVWIVSLLSDRFTCKCWVEGIYTTLKQSSFMAREDSSRSCLLVLLFYETVLADLQLFSSSILAIVLCELPNDSPQTLRD